MKVYMIREQEYADVNDIYASRLIEQDRAVPAGTFDETNGKYWLGKLKTGMEKAEEAEKTESGQEAGAATEAPPAKRKRVRR